MNAGNKRLTVGIIGGMGPEATLDLFRKILLLTPASCDEEHLNLQIDNNPVPGAKREPLCARARRLEVCGVDFLAMPCNAAHEHYDAICTSVNIPVLNMIREAVEAVVKTDPTIRKVGVLAWHETLTAGLYQDMLQEYHLESIIPNHNEWQAITELVNTVKSSQSLDQKKPAVLQIGNRLISRGAQAIILGCTELPLVFTQNDFIVPIVDATHCLASSVVNVATGKRSFEFQ